MIDGEAPNFHKLARILDDQLRKTKWLAGDHITIADVAVAAPMHLHNAQKLPLQQYPHLSRWYKGLLGITAWNGTQEPVNALAPNVCFSSFSRFQKLK